MGFQIFKWLKGKSSDNDSKLLEYQQSYHYQRGLELNNQGRDADAFEELKRELDEHPKNGLAHLLIAEIHQRHNVIGTALQACNNALNLLLKEGNPEYIAKAYCIRSEVYRSLNERDNWYNDALKAIEYNPDYVDAIGELADFHYYSKDYNASDVQFNKIIELQPHNPYGYMGRGRNDQGRNEHISAINHFQRASQMDSDYAAAYSFMAESLLALGRKTEAIDAIIKAVSIDENDRKSHDLMPTIARADMKGLFLKIKSQALKNPDNDSWYRLLGWVAAGQGDMKQAILAYQNAYKISAAPELCDFKAFCWSKLGAYDLALEDEKIALDKFPENNKIKNNYATYLAEKGLLSEAILKLTDLIEETPDESELYFNRGRFHFELHDYEKALDDFNTTISLNDNMALAFLYKGWSLSELGREEEAESMWQVVIDYNDKLVDSDYALPLALFFLDKNNEAIQKCNELVAFADKAENRLSCGDIYLYTASVYCRTGHETEAIDCVKKSLDALNNRFWYMSNGALLKPLAETEGFTSLISETRSKLNDEVLAIQSEMDGVKQQSIKDFHAEVPFIREGKMCKVQCTINNLPLHFIFDTGASDVTMSSVEATFMLKNGYLKESDLSGKQYYQTADGSIAEGVKVNLKEVVFGGLELSNVKAAVVTNQRAPLLLGQSILERLGRIEIDNDNMLIKINS